MKPLLVQALIWSGVALLLLATLSLYQRPDFLLTLANTLWSCF